MSATVEAGTVLGDPPGTAPPAARVLSLPAATGGGSRLLRFALANVRRRPERFVLSVLGIALALMAVVVVRTIAQGYASSGTASLRDVLRGEPLWVVGPAGVSHDPTLDALLPQGDAPTLQVPPGWTAHRVVAGSWSTGAGPIALYGRGDVAPGQVEVGAAAAQVLGVANGSSLTVGPAKLTVRLSGSGRLVTAPLEAARAVVGERGWWTVSPPAGQGDRRDLGADLSSVSGVPSTSDPARSPAPDGPGLIYDTVGGTGTGLATFEQRFSALYSGAVTGSALGLVSVVGLVLGFVIAVSSFLAAVSERRREFGIMSSIGLADEVLYFFLVESALVFVTAYLLGTLVAGAAVALVVPGMTTLTGWLAASGAVAAYLPAMAIVGALVPVHRLLQQRPVALLRDDA